MSALDARQDAVIERAAARMVVLERGAADLLDVLGLLPGQGVDAPTRLSTGFFDLDSSALRARRAS